MARQPTGNQTAVAYIDRINLMDLGLSLTEINRMTHKERETWLYVHECKARRARLDAMENEAKMRARRR